MSVCSSLSLVSWSRSDAMGQTSSIHYSELMKGAVSPNEPVGWGYPNERKHPPTNCQTEMALWGSFPSPGKYYCISIVYKENDSLVLSVWGYVVETDSILDSHKSVPEFENNEETSCSSYSS